MGQSSPTYLNSARQLFTSCNQSDVVVSQLSVVSVSNLNTNTVELSNLLLEVAALEVTANYKFATLLAVSAE